MIDIKFFTDNMELVQTKLHHRNCDISLDDIIVCNNDRKKLLQAVDALRGEKNRISKGKAFDVERSKVLSHEIRLLESQLAQVCADLSHQMAIIPNLPHDTVPVGKNAESNQLVAKSGDNLRHVWQKPHYIIAEALGMLDPARAAKVAGSRFLFYKGWGARLERAVLNLMLDTHANHGYTEIFPPFLVNAHSMFGTGQLPKFAEDMFKVENHDLYLIPTAEVPLTNMLSGEVIEVPQKYCAYSACFRAEAGSYGKDTRGLIRQHQFNKIELVKFTSEEESYAELDGLLLDATRILDILQLPYQVMLLCTGDMGFASAKTYDIEVWMPGEGRYVEISSCSNFETFQARRANIRYSKKGEMKFAHTINGSGLAVGRTVAAIIENYQAENGVISVPEALRPYLGADTIT